MDEGNLRFPFFAAEEVRQNNPYNRPLPCTKIP